MLKRNIARLIASALLVFTGAGCANYRVGTTLPPNLKTISVETFQNQSGEPKIEVAVTAAVLQEFQREGQLKLADNASADIVLTGVIKSYELDSMRYDSNSPKRTSEYRATIKVEFTAVERVSGDKVTHDFINGNASLPASGDLVSARRNVLPKVAEDAAKRVVSSVVSAW